MANLRHSSIFFAHNQLYHDSFDTKDFLVKWHWFWVHVWCTQDDFDDLQHFLQIIHCASLLMKADYLTKGLFNKKYEVNCHTVQGY